MTAFADYLDLRTAVLEGIGRPDIADVFDRLTRLAEAYLNRHLRTVSQVTTATVTFTDGTAPLPADFAQAIGLYDSYGREYVQQPPQSVKPAGTGGYFAIEGGNLVANGFTGDRSLQYYAQIPTLTAGPTTSNWLLQKYPSVYLYAVGREAARHIRDVEASVAMEQLLAREMTDAAADDMGARYSRARIRVQGVTP